MSKSVLGIVFNVAAIGLMFIPGVGTALGLGAKLLGGALTVAQAIGAGLMLASSVLLGPAKPKMPQAHPTDRLYATLVPTAPRKWVFGSTALATDIRYQTFTGTDQEYYWQVICCASHEVQSIDEIWLDNEKAWSAGFGVFGRYIDYLTVTTRTLGASGNGVAVDSTWTASCTLTGCAYVVLKFKLTGNSDNAQSPFAGGVTNRITIRGLGAKTYDPRLDSTVAGGSGTMSANDQATWAWNGSASRNPALQLLFFLLGWRINGKLALGMGLPAARIDLASFITAANLCDESVALNGGGTEPRYRCDGVIGENEDRKAVIEALCASMNATVRDAGGKLALDVIHNDLASPVGPPGGFTETDIMDGGKWVQTPPLSQSFNIVRGQRIDPSDQALYQPVDYPEVSLASPDGIDRIDTADCDFVQSNGQAQRLAKQRLQRNQYQGRYSFTGGERWWQVSIGEVVALSHQSYGWSNKLFRMAEQAIDETGPVKITLLEENAAIYQWDNNEAPPVAAGTPTIYDPLNAPVLMGLSAALGDLASIANDNVLAVPEKIGKLIPLNADLEARSNDVIARATTLGLSTADLIAARSEWQVTLARFGPTAWNDTSGDTTIYTPWFGDDLLANWTATAINLGTSGGWTSIQDNSAGSYLNVIRTGNRDTGQFIYSAGMVVKKQASASFTSLIRIYALDGAQNKSVDCQFNCATGAATVQSDSPTPLGPNDVGGLFDLGDSWFAWVQIEAPGDSTVIQPEVYPACGFAASAPAYDPAATGTIEIKGPFVVRGFATGLGHYYLYGRLAAYQKAIAALQQVIGQRDGSTAVVIDPIADVIVYADASGAVKAGELPRDVPITASIGTSNVTASGAWSMTATSGVTATIGAANGILTITALNVAEALIPVSFTYNGVTRGGKVHVVRKDDPPTISGGGGGGASVSTTTLAATSGTTYPNAVSAILTVAAGSGGFVDLYAPIGFKRATSAKGQTSAAGKWQWRPVSGTFADVAAETTGGVAARTNADPGDPVTQDAGSIAVAATKSGLTAGTSYEFHFTWREVAVSGTAAHVYRTDGVLTATGR